MHRKLHEVPSFYLVEFDSQDKQLYSSGFGHENNVMANNFETSSYNKMFQCTNFLKSQCLAQTLKLENTQHRTCIRVPMVSPSGLAIIAINVVGRVK